MHTILFMYGIQCPFQSGLVWLFSSPSPLVRLCDLCVTLLEAFVRVCIPSSPISLLNYLLTHIFDLYVYRFGKCIVMYPPPRFHWEGFYPLGSSFTTTLCSSHASWHRLRVFLPVVVPLAECHINGISQPIAFSIWVLSLSKMHFRYTNINASPFLFYHRIVFHYMEA